MVGDEHGSRCVGVSGKCGQTLNQVLTAGDIHTSAGLVQQQHFRVGHEGAGNQRTLALAVGEGAEGAVSEGIDTPFSQQLGGTLVVHDVVFFLPAAGHSVRCGHNNVGNLLVGGNLGCRSTGGQTNARAQVEYVNSAEGLVKDFNLAAGRVQAGCRNRKQSGLTGAVGAQNDPAFTFVHSPGNVVENLAAAANHGDILKVEYGAHGSSSSELDGWDAPPHPATRAGLSERLAHGARVPHIGFLARSLRGYRCRRVRGGAPHQMYLVRGAGASATAPIAAEVISR